MLFSQSLALACLKIININDHISIHDRYISRVMCDFRMKVEVNDFLSIERILLFERIKAYCRIKILIKIFIHISLFSEAFFGNGFAAAVHRC